MPTPFIAIIMGSKNDMNTMSDCCGLLHEMNIEHEINVLSAHRTPIETAAYVKDADQRGCQVFICAAGLAAHLAGAVAAHTIKPVIGVPIDAGALNGIDALLSTVQMPGGIPVATVAIGKTGAKNAAYLAAQILALHDETIVQALHDQREKKRKEILQR